MNGQEHHRQWLDHAGVWAAVAAAIAAAIAAGAASWQAYLTRENNIASQRAFVSVSITGEFLSVEKDRRTPKAINYVIAVANSGNTATKALDLLVRCAPAAEDLREPWSIIRQGQLPKDKVPIFVGPHATQQSGCSFPYEQITEMAGGKLFGYVLVDASYVDRLDGSRRKTQMAVKLAQFDIRTDVSPPVVTQLLQPVGKHNCADDECPAD